MKNSILIVEDQFIEANNLQIVLEKAGYRITGIARSVEVAMTSLAREKPDLVLLDIMLRGHETGIDFAKTLSEKQIAFIFLSANSNREILDQAKMTRPYGFLVKPFREKDVLVSLDIAWYLHSQRQTSLVEAKKTTASQCSSAFSLSKSTNMVRVFEDINAVSYTDTSVLILGESGTGKELVAKNIHALSFRKDKPLIVVNCAALPENLIESELFGHEKGAFTGAYDRKKGKFEQANDGTIFLDEIGELPLDLQAKMLRVLQEREIEPLGGKTKRVNVRVIAATNRNLEAEIANGRFRMDLFYRLNVFPIHLPALRERSTDIVPLAEEFLKKFSDIHHKRIVAFSKEVKQQLRAHNWPGNVRELENMIERTVVLAKEETISSIKLPLALQVLPIAEGGRPRTMEQAERDYIIAVLEKCNWKIYGTNGAAELLGLPVSTLNSRIKRLGIERTRPIFK